MILMTIPSYAKRVGLSRQWVHKMAVENNLQALKGVVHIELIDMGQIRKAYILACIEKDLPTHKPEST